MNFLNQAQINQQVLLTLDKGVANIHKYAADQHAGIVLFRPGSSGRGAVLAFLRKRLDRLLKLPLECHVTVVAEARIRIR